MTMFLPILQHVVDEYIKVYNTHRVQQINENGCFKGGHVPSRCFKKFECLHGQIFYVHKVLKNNYFPRPSFQILV
jgi:hypothetical protein